jgi:hypothetical protein
VNSKKILPFFSMGRSAGGGEGFSTQNEHKSSFCFKYTEYASGNIVREVVNLNREEPLPAYRNAVNLRKGNLKGGEIVMFGTI